MATWESLRALTALAQVDRSPLRRQTVDVPTTGQAVYDGLRSTYPGRSVLFKVETGLTANAEPELVHVLLANLIENAWKFTAPRDPAVIEVGSDAAGFFIRDNGVGFQDADAARMFRPFERLGTGFAGNGIGLSIVAKIVERHGGTVSAAGEPDKGATIRFSLVEQARPPP